LVGVELESGIKQKTFGGSFIMADYGKMDVNAANQVKFRLPAWINFIYGCQEGASSIWSQGGSSVWP
jgi:hypothetical protein